MGSLYLFLLLFIIWLLSLWDLRFPDHGLQTHAGGSAHNPSHWAQKSRAYCGWQHYMVRPQYFKMGKYSMGNIYILIGHSLADFCWVPILLKVQSIAYPMAGGSLLLLTKFSETEVGLPPLGCALGKRKNLLLAGRGSGSTDLGIATARELNGSVLGSIVARGPVALGHVAPSCHYPPLAGRLLATEFTSRPLDYSDMLLFNHIQFIYSIY